MGNMANRAARAETTAHIDLYLGEKARRACEAAPRFLFIPRFVPIGCETREKCEHQSDAAQ